MSIVIKSIILITSFFSFFIFLTPTHAQSPTDASKKINEQNTSANHALYEAVSGESAEDDKTLWDSFYKHKVSAFGNQPISILKEFISSIPVGRALVPAMGEGRNAIYLAKKGFNVEGIDISEVAVQQALSDAKAQHVNMKATVKDLKQAKFADQTYDLIVVSLYYDRDFILRIKNSLKKGGWFIIYNKLTNPKHARSDSPDDFYVKPNELKELFKEKDYKIKTYREYMDLGSQVAAIVVKKI